MPGLYSHTTRATGTVLTAAIYNADHQNHIDNFEPSQMDDYSTNAAEMQSTADPGEVGTESLPTSLAGELERLRHMVKEITGEAQWYVTPSMPLRLIERVTLNSTSHTVSITASSWRAIHLRGRRVILDTSTAHMLLRVNAGGGVLSGASDYEWQLFGTVLGIAPNGLDDAADTAIRLFHNVANGQHGFFDLIIDSPNATSDHRVQGTGHWPDAAAGISRSYVIAGMALGAAAAITQVQLLPSSGSFTSGTLEVWGEPA